MQIMNSPAEHQTTQLPPIEYLLDGHYDRAGELSGRQAVLRLMYTDVPMSDHGRRESTAHTLSAPNTFAYARELQAMDTEVGIETVDTLAGEMSGAAVDVLRTLGMEPTGYAKSTSWALHDIAKQRCLSREAHDDNYPYADSIGNMLAQPELRLLSIDRMVGWEIDLAARNDRLNQIDTSALFDADPQIDEKILAILRDGRRSPKFPYELSSEAIGQLGKAIRDAIDKNSALEGGTTTTLGRHSAATPRHRKPEHLSANSPLTDAKRSLDRIARLHLDAATGEWELRRPTPKKTEVQQSPVKPVVPKIGEFAIGDLSGKSLEELTELAAQHAMTIPPREGTPKFAAYQEKKETLAEAIRQGHARRSRGRAQAAASAVLGAEIGDFRNEVMGRR